MGNIKLNSLAVALFLCGNPLSWVFPSVSGIIIGVVLLSFVLVLGNGEARSIIKFDLSIHLSIGLILLFFLFSLSQNYDDVATSKYFGSFLAFGIIGIYLSNIRFNIYSVFKYIALLSIPLFLVVVNLNLSVSENNETDYGMWMGVSYGLLRIILALIVLNLIYRKSHSKILVFIFGTMLILYLSIYFKFASRGAVLSIFVFLVSFYFLNSKKIAMTKVLLLGLLAAISLSIFLNISSFLSSTNYLLNDVLDLEIRFFTKMELLIESGDIDNGRAHLINEGVAGILESPLFGNGIGSFEEKHGYYVHNVFIQLFYEGGIFFIIPFLLIVFYSLHLLMTNKISLEEKAFVLFLICSGLIELLFSSVYWRSLFFWFYIFYVYNIFLKNRYERV